MNGEAPTRAPLPDPVKVALDEFGKTFDLDVDLWTTQNGGGRVRLYPEEGSSAGARTGGAVTETVTPRDGPALELEVRARGPRGAKEAPEAVAAVLRSVLERTYDFAQEIRFFTYELSERYEEINLLYSISETLGSILRLDDAARVILGEVCDVLGALRGSLWVYDPDRDVLHLTASVGEGGGTVGPITPDDPDKVTAQVFREGRSMIVSRDAVPAEPGGADAVEPETFMSVPIRYTPPAGEARTVGVINLIGRRHGGRFTASDQKLLSAIASQVGAALENNRLIQESLAQERVTREMELAHNLQMKLLPAAEKFEGARVAARVEPAQSVGGDFYHLLKLPAGRIGVMVGDVSSHGFSAALIMALAISAATIYASEFGTPAKVLRHLDDALREELESTEMYLTLFYAVIDPPRRRMLFSNAGHPHAFVVHGDGTHIRLDATDPPVGIAGDDAYGQLETPWDPATDLLFCFTDGLSDTLEVAAEATGEQILLREVAKRRDGTPQEIVDALFEMTAQGRTDIPADDRTALILRT